MLNQTTNKIQRLGFGYKKIDAIKHQLIINGAGKGSQTLISTLGRSHNNRYTIPAYN